MNNYMYKHSSPPQDFYVGGTKSLVHTVCACVKNLHIFLIIAQCAIHDDQLGHWSTTHLLIPH